MDALLDAEATLYISEGLLVELADVLAREKFRARLQQSGSDAATMVAGFRELARAIEPAEINVPPALRDHDDIHVLSCAVAATADAIVTGDHDLLTL